MLIKIENYLIINSDNICSIEQHEFFNRNNKEFDGYVVGLTNGSYIVFGDFGAINDTRTRFETENYFPTEKELAKYFKNGTKISIHTISDYNKLIEKLQFI